MLRPDVKFYLKHPILYIKYRKAQKEFAQLFAGYKPEVIKTDMSQACHYGYRYVMITQRYHKGLSSYDEWKSWQRTHCDQCIHKQVICQYCVSKSKQIETMLNSMDKEVF